MAVERGHNSPGTVPAGQCQGVAALEGHALPRSLEQVPELSPCIGVPTSDEMFSYRYLFQGQTQKGS